MAILIIEEFLAKCKTKGEQKMDQINGFNVSSRNNFEVDRKPHRVAYLTKLPSGTTIEISGNEKIVRKHDTHNVRYDINQFNSERVITKYSRTSLNEYNIDEYVPTPKSTIKKVESLKKILSKILPENIKEAISIKTVKGKWIRRM